MEGIVLAKLMNASLWLEAFGMAHDSLRSLHRKVITISLESRNRLFPT